MNVTEIVILVAMVGYAVFMQTQRHEVVGNRRFTLALVYGVIGLAVGGIHPPNTPWEIAILVASVAASVIIGLVRGHCTSVWREGETVYAQGTALTICLFLLLILFKVALGTLAYVLKVSDDGGFGEVLLLIAVMVAFQAQIVWGRAKALGASSSPVARAVVDAH